jgi:hypothetical protein
LVWGAIEREEEKKNEKDYSTSPPIVVGCSRWMKVLRELNIRAIEESERLIL